MNDAGAVCGLERVEEIHADARHSRRGELAFLAGDLLECLTIEPLHGYEGQPVFLPDPEDRRRTRV